MERFTVALPDNTARRLKDRAVAGGIGAALDRYIDAGASMRRRLAEQEGESGDKPISLFLQDRLYDQRGLPD